MGLYTVEGSGKTYVNKIVMTDDEAHRFETAEKILADITIIVVGAAILFGNSNAQTYPVSVESTLGYSSIDISSLYFKNAEVGVNGTVHILAVEV